MIFYFSGTGNSQWIAQELAKTQHEELVFIPECIRNQHYKFELRANEKVGFVFPIYSWGPPPIVQQFVRELSLSGYNNHYLFFVCSCGDDIGLTKEVFAKLISTKGWECRAGFSVAMPNNYVLLPGFDVDNKELESKKLTEAVQTVKDISRFINVESDLFLCHKGAFPFIKTRLINPLFNKYPLNPQNFLVTDDCIGCGQCEKVCPMINITLIDNKPTWGENCTSCLACYHICPKQAVQYGKRTQSKGRYFNPLV